MGSRQRQSTDGCGCNKRACRNALVIHDQVVDVLTSVTDRISLQTMDDVCRLCSKCDNTLLDVFENELDKELCNKIGVCFGILITRDDKITKKVCKQCYFLINSYSELRISAINNDSKLKRNYEERIKHENEVKTEIKPGPSHCPPALPLKRSPPKNRKNSPVEKENKPNSKDLKSRSPKAKRSLKEKQPLKGNIKKEDSPQVQPKLETSDESKNADVTTVATAEQATVEQVMVEQVPVPKPKRKKFSYHSSVLRIKRTFPGIKLPRRCWTVNIEPFVQMNNIPEKYKPLLESHWAINVNNQRPGLYLRRIKRKHYSDSESDVSVTGPRSDIPESFKSDANMSSYCPSPTFDADGKLKKKKYCDLSPSNLNNILHNRNRTCKLTGFNIYNETYDDDDLDDMELPKKRLKKDKENTELEKTDDMQSADTENNKEEIDTSEVSLLNVSSENLLMEANKASKTYICQTCSQVFDTQKSLREHQKLHLKNTLRCFKCSKSFPIVEDLIKHNLQVHAKDSSDSGTDDMETDVILPESSPDKRARVAKKSTTQMTISDTFKNMLKNKLQELENTSKSDLMQTAEVVKMDEIVDLLSDDDCELVSETNVPGNRDRSMPLLNSSQDNNLLNVTKTQLDTAVNSIIKNPKKDELKFVAELGTNKPFEEIAKENKLTSVNISDEDYYLNYVFEKNIKGTKNKGAELLNEFCHKKQDEKKIWFLKDMEKMLDKAFIPVEFTRSSHNGVLLKYNYTGNKRIKPKSTTYKWSAFNAVDIPKTGSGTTKTFSELSGSVLTKSGEIYSMPTNMEIVGITQTTNDQQNALIVKTTTSNVKQLNVPLPPLWNIAPKNGPITGQSTMVKKFNESNTSLLKSNPKNLIVNGTTGDKYIAKVLPDGTLQLVPTTTTLPQLVTSTNSVQPIITTTNTLQPVQTVAATTNVLIQSNNVQETINLQPIRNMTLVNNHTKIINTNPLAITNQTPVIVSNATLNITKTESLLNVNNQIGQITTAPIENSIPVSVPVTQNPILTVTQPIMTSTPAHRHILPKLPPTITKTSSPKPESTTNNNGIAKTNQKNSGTILADTKNDSNSNSTENNVTKPLLRIKNLSELTEKPSTSSINTNIKPSNSNNNGDARFHLQKMYVKTLTNYVNSVSNDNPLAANVIENNTDNEYLQIS